MKYPQINQIEDQNIPIYGMGDQTPCTAPIVICRYTQKTRVLAPMHRHHTFQVNYVVKGNLLHKINNTIYPLVSGDIFVIPPYIPHQLKATDKNDADYEIIELEFMPTEVFGKELDDTGDVNGETAIYDYSYIKPFFVNESNVRPRLNLIGKDHIMVETLLDEMLREFQKKNIGYQLAMKADLSKLLVIAGRSCYEEKKEEESPLFDHHRQAMSKAIAYINQHFDEQITIEDASKIAMMSQSYFSYLFKIMTKKTFVEYLHDIRLKKAMFLLKTTDDQILNICYCCGFNSINYFNRVFKQEVGAAPREYRRMSRLTKPSVFMPNDPQDLMSASG